MDSNLDMVNHHKLRTDSNLKEARGTIRHSSRDTVPLLHNQALLAKVTITVDRLIHLKEERATLTTAPQARAPLASTVSQELLVVPREREV